jgi:hypothetical protein
MKLKPPNKWVILCKRTESPKLEWLARKLGAAGIANKIEGSSFHAPLLWVKEQDLDPAWEILDPVDDYPDDHEMFQEGPLEPCLLCGGPKPTDQSCGCFDNHCE